MATIADPIVGPEALDTMEGVQVLDVRWRLGGTREEHYGAYRAGHIPGAIFVDLEEVATGAHRPGAGRHPLPSPVEFRRALARLGVDLARPIVVVDDAMGSIAARLWWMLDALGTEAYLLDGGIASWQGPRCTEDCVGVPRTPSEGPAHWPEAAVLDPEALAELLDQVLVVDVREEARYLGEHEPIDRVAGHIPGAWSLPVSRALARGRFPSPEEARALLEPIGRRPLVASCGSGVTACTLVAIARRAGIRAVLASGSYSGWVEDPSRPVCTDPCGRL